MSSYSHIPSLNIATGLRSRGKKEELSYSNLGHFFEYVWDKKLANFHWEIVELIMECKRNPLSDVNPLLILAPRDHAKTTIVAEATPLWLAGIDNLELCQIICSVTSLARKRLSTIENCIRNSARYQNLFGKLYPYDVLDYTSAQDYVWTKDEMEVVRDKSAVWELGGEERDATFAGFGITTSVEGGRATYQAYDDIVNQENSRTETGRTNVREKYWMSFEPMLLPHGFQVIVGTTYHYSDFYCSELIPKFDTEKLYIARYPDIVEEQLVSAGFS